MKNRSLAAVVAATLSLAGCVQMQPVIEKGSALQPDSGYVAASFVTSGGADTFGFGIANALDREWVMPFRAEPGKRDGDHLGMIALPPGDYRLAFWVASRAAEPQAIARGHALGKPFTVKPGHVVYLGKFSARVVNYGHTISMSIHPEPMGADEVWTRFTEAYPGFAQAPIECMVCKAPAAGATQAALPVSREAPDFAAAHDVVIHYDRAGAANTLQLLAWESFDGKTDRRALAKSPLGPSGNDDFGAYWTLNDLNFRNGKINFAVRNLNVNAPLQDRRCLLSDGREVWIREGDSRCYASEDEALAAAAGRK